MTSARCFAFILVAMLGTCSQALAADAAAILQTIDGTRLPIMQERVRPLLAKSGARTTLRRVGEERGFGKEWDTEAEAWKRAEQFLVSSILGAAGRRPVSEPSRLAQCLDILKPHEIASLEGLFRSAQWRNALQGIDMTGAVFAMLGDVDVSLRRERDNVFENLKPGSGGPPTDVQALQAGLPRGAQPCVGAAVERILAGNGPPFISEQTLGQVAPFLSSFEKQNAALAGNWMLNAARRGNRARVLQLLDSGVSTRYRGVGELEGLQVLHVLAESPRRDDAFTLAALVISRGADVNARDTGGGTPLLNAVSRNVVKLAEMLLESGADPQLEGRAGTPLRVALSYGNLALAEFLVEHGASVKEISPQHGSLLASAVEKERVASVDWLLSHGIDPNAKDRNEYTAMHKAAGLRSDAMLRRLAAAGGNANARSTSGDTPLHIAVVQVQYLDGRGPKLVAALLDAGADPNAADRNGFTPLHILVRQGGEQSKVDRLRAFEMLLAKGANVRASNDWGSTPLHEAVLPEIVGALIAAGANIGALDRHGQSPLKVACMMRREAAAKALISLGAAERDCDKR